jgi:hypothetical protein
MTMDYIREFDIRLEKEMFYAGEVLSGVVILDTIENFKLRSKQYILFLSSILCMFLFDITTITLTIYCFPQGGNNEGWIVNYKTLCVYFNL